MYKASAVLLAILCGCITIISMIVNSHLTRILDLIYNSFVDKKILAI